MKCEWSALARDGEPACDWEFLGDTIAESQTAYGLHSDAVHAVDRMEMKKSEERDKTRTVELQIQVAKESAVAEEKKIEAANAQKITIEAETESIKAKTRMYEIQMQAGNLPKEVVKNNLVKPMRCTKVNRGIDYKIWKKDFREYERIRRLEITEDLNNKVEIETRIRIDLMETLKNSDREDIRKYTESHIQNNEIVNEDIEKIIEKLDDKFQPVTELEDQMTIDRFLTIKYKGSTSDVIDEIDYNRKKLFDMLKINDPKAYEGMNDQVIVMGIFKKGVDNGRIKEIEEKELDKEFKEKKYKWEERNEGREK